MKKISIPIYLLKKYIIYLLDIYVTIKVRIFIVNHKKSEMCGK